VRVAIRNALASGPSTPFCRSPRLRPWQAGLPFWPGPSEWRAKPKTELATEAPRRRGVPNGIISARPITLRRARRLSFGAAFIRTPLCSSGVASPGGRALLRRAGLRPAPTGHGLFFSQGLQDRRSGQARLPDGQVQTLMLRARNSSSTHDNIIVTSSQGKSALGTGSVSALSGLSFKLHSH
jgi:hypothetical protein